jgi:hypothetical protein
MTQPIDVVLLHLDGKVVTSYSYGELDFFEPVESRLDMEVIKSDQRQHQLKPFMVRKITSKIHRLVIPNELLRRISNRSTLGKLLLRHSEYRFIADRESHCEVAISIDPEIKEIICLTVNAELTKQTKELERQNERLALKLSLEETARKKAEDLLTANLATKRQFMCLPLWRKIWQLITKGGPYE